MSIGVKRRLRYGSLLLALLFAGAGIAAIVLLPAGINRNHTFVATASGSSAGLPCPFCTGTSGQSSAIITAPAPTATAAPFATVGPTLTPTPSPTPSPTPVPAPNTADTNTFLYLRVDYPLQIPVDASDTATLSFSIRDNILTATPAPGIGSATSGQTAPGEGIGLPSDLEHYSDITLTVVSDAGDSPVVWQLTTAPRQSLLSEGSPRAYRSLVTFRWTVHALATGENATGISFLLDYTYLDGSHYTGDDEFLGAAPIIAVQSTPNNTFLPQIKLPVGAASLLAAAFALFLFVRSITDTTGNVVSTAQVVRGIAGWLRDRFRRRRKSSDSH